jgi:hypothetical protein
MSYYVESLLRNRDMIRVNPDIESDEFNDLLVVERAVKDLQEKGVLSSEDIRIIRCISDVSNFNMAEEQFDSNRVTISKKFEEACNKIAFALGNIFTDVGYLNYIGNKYSLSEEQLNTLNQFMNSRFKHKLMHK